LKQSAQISNLLNSLAKAKERIKLEDSKVSRLDKSVCPYENLSAVIAQISEQLGKEGIRVFQYPKLDGEPGRIFLTTIFLHTTGEWLEESCSDEFDKMGVESFDEAFNYLSRYALPAMMGMFASGSTA
jgi:hypothetical protein